MTFFKRDDEKAGGSFQVLPEGEYEVFFSVTTPAATKAGNPMIKAELVIDPVNNEVGGKRKIFDYLLFQENANFKVNQIAKIFDITTAENIDDYAKQIYGKRIRIKTKNEEYEGQMNPKVSYYKASTIPEGSASTDDPFAGGASTDTTDLPF